MISLKQSFWLFALILSLSCSGWFFATNKDMRKLDAQTLANTVDMTLTHVTVQQFNQEGRIAHRLSTPHVHHIPSENVYHIQTPEVMMSQKNQSPMTLKAHLATAFQSGHHITFHQQVILHQAKDEHTEESTLTTESMTFFPKEKLAVSNDDVVFERPGQRVLSKGIKAYLKDNKRIYLTKAQGNYVPKKKDKPEVHAFADLMTYDPKQQIIELIGHARITQGDDSFSGAYIKYDILHQHTETKSDGHTRTKLIFHSEQLASLDKPLWRNSNEHTKSTSFTKIF